MELAMGAMASLGPKLAELLKEEYVVQKGLKPEIESLSRELVMIHAVLAKVSRVPPEELDEVDKIWASQVRELSYDMEDAVDAFMVRVVGRKSVDPNFFKRISGKITSVMKKAKDRHQISGTIKEIKSISQELAELRARYTFNNSGADHTKNCNVDPRVLNLYKYEDELVGIEGSRDELIRRLTETEGDMRLKVISIVGFGGLGKTSLAKIVYDKLKGQSFDCAAFVSVGRNPKITGIFESTLEQLDKTHSNVNMARWNEGRFIDELHTVLQAKRYFIVVDDIWDKKSWDIFRCALKDNKHGSKIIVTTRNSDVGIQAGDVYKLKPLCRYNSKMLFYKRIFREEQKCPENDLAEVTDKILDKCGGVPLAIIAIASLLVDRPWEDWSKTYDSINFGHEDNTMRILSYSYYDLPSYLKLCLLDLGMFPEDSTISKDRSIWRWIAQGFIHLDNEGGHLFQLGERYFNELLNRSMIQPVENSDHSICACRLHDIVLDLIQALSREENFMTKFSLVNCTHSEIGTKMKEMSQPSPSLHSKARRLSIEGCILQQIPQDTIGMPELLRTLSIQNSEIQNMHPLSIFKVCRVLMIESSKIPHLRDLGKLLHLKFLVIDKAPIDELPKEIGNLRSLQSLIISGTRIRELPLTVFSLTQLMYMRIEEIGNLPVDRIGNLTSLEELCLNPIFGESAAYDFARELGKLTRLRVLEINFYDAVDDSWHQVFLQSLCSLREIHNLDLQFVGETSTAGATWEGWELPRQLQLLYIACISFSWLPATINRSLVPGLRYLTASVETIGAQDIENLGRLPELQYLCLYLNGPTPILIPEFIVCSADGFKNLRACKVSMQFKFLQGAMPKLEILDFSVPVRFRRQTMNEISDFDFGLVNLISLERVSAWVSCFDASEMDVAKAEAALRRAVEDHPNRPTLQMIRTDEYDMLSDQDLKVQEAEPSFRISVREMKDNGTDPDIYSNLQSCLEKVNIDVDCENANLREVEEVEAALRQAANVDTKSPSPTLELTRINTDKMVSASDNCYSENDQDDSAGNNSITQLPSVQNEQDIWSDKKEMLDS